VGPYSSLNLNTIFQVTIPFYIPINSAQELQFLLFCSVLFFVF
jgi:hypothetical protein